MKKVVLSLAIIFGLGVAQANAQRVSFGVKADANMSSFILSDFDGLKSNIGFGATVGGFSTISLNECFAIQPELLFQFQNSTFEERGEKENFRYLGLELPVYALKQWNTVDGGRFFAGVGPVVSMGLDAQITNDDFDMYAKIDSSDESTLRRFGFGFGALAGMEFSNRMQVNASYKIGVVNAMDAGRDHASMLPHSFSVGLGYRF